MTRMQRTGLGLKTGVAALTVCWLAGNAMAATRCVEPQDLTALQIAALQQQLMVAALTCHDVAAYNGFVISHRPELQASDRALLRFFRNAQKGDDGYNAYKTKLANDSSLRSVRDGRFCPNADAAFSDARAFKGSLAELVAQQPSRVATGYAPCMAQAREGVQLAEAVSRPPVRRAIAPPRERAIEPRAGQRAREDRNATNRKGEAEQDFETDDSDVNDDDHFRGERQYIPDVIDATPRYEPEFADAAPPRAYDRRQARGASARYDRANDARDNRDEYDYRQAVNNADGDDRDGYDRPDRSYADRRSAFPPHTRLVRGDDGRWYLLYPRR